MKALSVKQPWASFISEGMKTIETRSWPTKYRGDILICASKTPDSVSMHHYLKVLNDDKFVSLSYPNGVALCIAEIYDCWPMAEDHQAAAKCLIYPGAYSWFLKNIRRFEPFPIKGQLRIFNVDVNEKDLVFL